MRVRQEEAKEYLTTWARQKFSHPGSVPRPAKDTEEWLLMNEYNSLILLI